MIEFQNVKFAYEKGNEVLHDMSFRIDSGESVGLIGANGAGKSTIMKLLLGLIQGEGKVLIDGIEVKKETLSDIRARLGFVLQNSDNQMFMPTVYEDMIFGPLNYGLPREEVDRRVDEVLARLNLEYLKNRYNHKISGGEKRMAAIATILAMEPAAILMDEPTSALDPKAEYELYQKFHNMVQGRTAIFVSHRLSISKLCDKIAVFSDGSIVEYGSHDELMEHNGMYAEFFNLQSQYYL